MGVFNDEFDGVGGTYHVINGRRVRKEDPTKDHPEGNCARNADGTRVDADAKAAAPQQDTQRGSEAGMPAGAGPVEASPIEDHASAAVAPSADV